MKQLTKFLLIFSLSLPLSFAATPAAVPNYQKNYQNYGNPPINKNPPPVAENGSYKGEPSARTGKSKNTYVKGYSRRDGTHVQGHYKSKKK
jgi:hypothetical protein